MNALASSLLLASALATILPVTLSASNGGDSHPYCLDDASVSRKVLGGDGKIIDISHHYHPGMPLWGSDAGLGEFLWLQHSMKNGSLSNNSEMKLSVHAGTHVDAPAHLFDHYYDAGFDVDTLDLRILNGIPPRFIFWSFTFSPM